MTDVPPDFLNSMGTGPSPFGDLTPSARQRQAISFDTAGACTNLLEKAATALRHGDEAAADRLLHRAATKPFDRREGSWPILEAAHMMLFNLVVDTLEESAQDDHRWLDVSIQVLDDAVGTAHDEMNSVLAVVASEYELTRREYARLSSRLSAEPTIDEEIDPRRGPEQLLQHARSVLGICIAFTDAAGVAGIASPAPL